MLTKTLEGTSGCARHWSSRLMAKEERSSIIRSCEFGAPFDSSLTEWTHSSS